MLGSCVPFCGIFVNPSISLLPWPVAVAVCDVQDVMETVKVLWLLRVVDDLADFYQYMLDNLWTKATHSQRTIASEGSDSLINPLNEINASVHRKVE